MNPETALTLEQLKLICVRHSILYRSHRRITIGFSHEVHRLNDDLIIKLFNGEDERPFRTERALLASRQPFCKPEFVAAAERDDVIERSYIIMTYVPGASLGSRWHLANDTQRERLIEEICGSLKVINQIKPEAIALELGSTWQVQTVKRGEDLATRLRAAHTIDAPTAERVQRLFQDNAAVFTGTAVSPVYWDIHFDNFIVNENFSLEALIDLENVALTALDYPLFVIQKQTDEPEKYLSEADERYADKKDYMKLQGWCRKYYPEMFAFDNLETRLRLYQLLDTLHLLVDWPQVKSLYVKLDGLLGALE